MLKIAFAVFLAISIICLDAASALARYSSSASGSGCCSGGRHGGGRKNSGAKKEYTSGFIRHCKKASCFKKHPSGEYYVSPKDIKG